MRSPFGMSKQNTDLGDVYDDCSQTEKADDRRDDVDEVGCPVCDVGPHGEWIQGDGHPLGERFYHHPRHRPYHVGAQP